MVDGRSESEGWQGQGMLSSEGGLHDPAHDRPTNSNQ